MRISFIILFMLDLYKDNHVHAFVNFLKKLLLRNNWLDFYQISQECSLDRDSKHLFTVTEKSRLWSDTGAQAPSFSIFLCALKLSYVYTGISKKVFMLKV